MRRWVFVASLSLLLAPLNAWRVAVGESPALVVVVSVDQWSYEYLQRFKANFSNEGLVWRCANEGVWFSNCRHGHLFTVTAPGHSVLLAGCYPDRNGMVGNEWYLRGRGERVYCVADESARLVGPAGGELDVSVEDRLILRPLRSTVSGAHSSPVSTAKLGITQRPVENTR